MCFLCHIIHGFNSVCHADINFMTFILNYVPQSLFAFFVDVIVCHRGSLITGSSSGHLRLWSVVGVGEMRLPGENDVYVSFQLFFFS